MAAARTLVVNITGGTQGLGRATRDAQKQLSGLSRTAGASGKEAGKRFGAGVTGMAKRIVGPLAAVFAASAVKDFLQDSINLASDLNESGTKSLAIFGKDGKKYLDQFAGGAAKALGQTRQEVIDSASTFGTFGKAAGKTGPELAKFSTGLVGLSSDLASFFNVDPSEAAEAISSGLRGEAEPLRKYGVLLDDASLKAQAMSMGLIKATKDSSKIKSAQNRAITTQRAYNEAVKQHGKGSDEALKAESSMINARSALSKATTGTIGPLTQQQKVLAAEGLIMKQTKDAQGDFTRTSGGLANQQRILTAQWKEAKTTIGSAFLPIMVKVVSMINSKFQPAFDKAKDVVKTLTDSIKSSGIGDTLKSIFGGIGDSIKGVNLGTITSAFTPLAQVLKGMAPSLGSVGTAFRDIGAAVGGVLATVLPSLVPAFVGLAAAVGGTLSAALPTVSDALQKLASMLPPILNGLAPLVPVIGSVVTGLIDFVAPVLSSKTAVLAAVGAFAAWKLISAGISFGKQTASLITNTKAWTLSTRAKIADKIETIRLRAMYAGDFVRNIAASTKHLILSAAAWARDTAAKVANAAAGKVVAAAGLAKTIGLQTAALARSTASWFAHRTAMLASAGASKAVQAAGLLRTVTLQTGALIKNAAVWTVQKGAMIAASVAQKAVAAGQWLINAAMTANPIGLVIAAIALLVGGLILAYKKSETFRKIVNGAFEGVKKVAGAVFKWLSGAVTKVINFVRDNWGTIKSILTNPIGFAVRLIKNNWDKITGAFTRANKWVAGAFRSAWRKISDVLLWPVKWAWGKIQEQWDKITGKFGAAKDWVSGTWKKGWNAVKGWMGDAVESGRKEINTEWENTKDRFSKAKDWVSGTWSRSWKATKWLLSDPVKNGKKLIATMLGKTGLQSTFSTAVTKIGGIWDKIKEPIMKPIRWVVDFINKHFIKGGINKFLGAIGVPKAKQIPWLTPIPKMASGGRVRGSTPFQRGGTDRILRLLDHDEMVVKKDSARNLDRELPGGLDYLNRTGRWPVGPAAERYGVNQNQQPGPGVPSKLIGVPADLRLIAKAGPRQSDRSGFGAPNPVGWAAGRVGDMGWYNRCLAFVNAAWDYTIGRFRVATARQSMNAGPTNMIGRPPSGAGVYWDTGPAGHIALAAGDGSVFSNDIRAAGRIDRVPQQEINKWGPYRGWWHPLGAKAGSGGFNVGGLFNQVVGFLKDLTPIQWLGDRVAGFKERIITGLGDHPWAAGLAMVPGYLFKTAKDRLSDKFDQLWGSEEPAGSGVERWRGTVRQALGIAGLPTSEAYINAWLRQIQSESGGNPRAIQGNIGDVNNASGDLAHGLVQVIGSTFAAYRNRNLPNDRFHPLANLVAGMNWAKFKYGANHLGVIGHGHGYDNGGYLPTGRSVVYNNTGKPEPVLTDRQWSAIMGAGGGGGESITFVIEGALDADSVARQIESMLVRRGRLKHGVHYAARTR